MSSSPITELEQRKLIAQVSDRSGLEAHLTSSSRTLYCGFDPTADSLHIGNLVPLLMLRRFQLFGHRPIALVGGATGLIGDPSFKGTERSLNAREVVEGWVGPIREQVSRFVDLTGNNAAIVVDNLDWTRNLDVVSFLREIGKHFSVNAMIRRTRSGRGSTQRELGSRTPNSATCCCSRWITCSFASATTAPADWRQRPMGQHRVGHGSCATKLLGRESFALTVPLVTKADGTKFGKTESGSCVAGPTTRPRRTRSISSG